MGSVEDRPVVMHPLIQGIFDTTFPVLKPSAKAMKPKSKPEEKEKKGGKDD